jgi:DNA-binding NtrC family response regulator
MFLNGESPFPQLLGWPASKKVAIDRVVSMERPWQVLIVGNDAECAKVLAKGLHAFLPLPARPTRTTLSASPEAALRLLDTLPPERLVVVADEDLPPMGGARLLAAVHARRADACRVLLTGDPNRRMADPPFDHAFETPMGLRDLVLRLARLAS